MEFRYRLDPSEKRPTYLILALAGRLFARGWPLQASIHAALRIYQRRHL